MTCIVGIADGAKVWIGGDSAGVAGWSLTVRADEKVFAVGTGTDLSPAVSAFADGATVSSQDVDSALNLP